MWVSTERSYRLIQTPFKSAKNTGHTTGRSVLFISGLCLLSEMYSLVGRIMIRVYGIEIRDNFGYHVTNCNSSEAYCESHAMNAIRYEHIVLQMKNNYSEMDHQLNVKFQTAIFVLFANLLPKSNLNM